MKKETVDWGIVCYYTFWIAILMLFVAMCSFTTKSDYINEHLSFALEEQQLYHIPASVTLAQGILESGWGESKASTKYNNHFGIRCQNKKHSNECVCYIDAGNRVRLLKYQSVKDSYRAHSIYLTTGKYKDLPNICGKSWSWCQELQKRGYSTDSNYANKLQQIISKYNLEQYDKF